MQNDAFNGLPLPQKKRSWLVPVILGTLLLVSLIFALWSFLGMNDYKNNSDKKVSAAVEKALAEQKKKLDAEFEEKEKSPFQTFKAGVEFGSLSMSYPKSWGMYVDSKVSGSSSSIDGYAHPGYVPSITSDTAFALRIQVSTRDYSSELKSFDGAIKSGAVRMSPYRPELVSTVLGSRIEGQVSTKRTGVMYLFPLRDKSIKIWTESSAYNSDLDNVMKSLTFVP